MQIDGGPISSELLQVQRGSVYDASPRHSPGFDEAHVNKPLGTVQRLLQDQQYICRVDHARRGPGRLQVAVSNG